MNDLQETSDDGAARLPAVTRDFALDNTQVAREQSETLVAYSMAQRFPRNVMQARADIQNAFARPRLAEVAQYEYAKGGTDIKGASIRAAEALAQYWGNIDSGWEVVNTANDADGVPVSRVKVYAVDYQGRNRATITFPVRHWRNTKRGGYPLRDDREVYELTANMAARRRRACILAVIPADVVDDALDQAASTLAAKADTSPEAMQKMLAAFTPYGVTREHIEGLIQRTLDSISPGQVVRLKRIWASLRDGMSVPHQWFTMDGARDEDGTGAGASLAAVKGALATGAAGATPGAAGATRADMGASVPPPPVPPATPTPTRAPLPGPEDEDVQVLAGRMSPEQAAAMLADVVPTVEGGLHRIRAAQTLADLAGMDELIGQYPAEADRAILTESLMQRERQLAAARKAPGATPGLYDNQ